MATGILDIRGVVKAVLESSGDRLAESMPMPPEAYALSRFLDEAAGKRLVGLSDVEREVQRLIEAVEADEEQRRRLLEQRELFCRQLRVVETLAEALEGLAEALGEDGAAASAAASALRTLKAQCSPAWARLSPREKARILAPLYLALHHLRLATSRTGDAKLHAEQAEALALLAEARLEETGLQEDEAD